MIHFKKLAVAVAALAFTAETAWAETPALRMATLESGTVNWELDTIKHYGLDTANGFTLEVTGLAANPATQVAFLGGEADVIVSDWLWVARQRAEGQDFVFIPYSTSVGGLLVPGDSTVQTLADLAGQKVGVAGGPTDKNWLILRAYAAKEYGLDLAAETEQVFGAPPLIMEAALGGEVAGAINFWHMQAKMEVAGMRKIIDVSDAATALGLDPSIPLLGYVIRGEMVRDNPDLAAGLAAASRAAKDLLATDDAAWARLRDRMNANSDEQFAALVAGFRAGIPGTGPIDTAKADAMVQLMAEFGGEELMGSVTALPEGVFYSPAN
jgi:NitT/TauT family transport system substrate-binding protein